MRSWGRIPAGANNPHSSAIGSFIIGESGIGNGSGEMQWIEVTTDENGYNDAVWLTTLAQVLKLGLNEDPIFGNYGIPAQVDVRNQMQPDYYVTLTQQAFEQYFTALIVTKNSSNPPTYTVNATTNPNSILLNPIPV